MLCILRILEFLSYIIVDVFISTYIAPFQINIIGRSTQQVGSSLTLDCTITDMGNNTNSLEIVWITNNMILQRTIVMPTVINNLPVYTDSYTISLLTTSDQGRMIQCMANSTNPPVIDSGNVMLNITGKFICLFLVHSYVLYNGNRLWWKFSRLHTLHVICGKGFVIAWPMQFMEKSST